MTTDKPRYISNRDLLAEIAKSKLSYCWLQDPAKHARYDVIVQRLTDITPEVIEVAKAKRAAFLSTKTAPVAASSINTADLVFRVMTSEHIPEDPLRKRRGGDPNVPMVAKTNFPSFKHYMMKGKSLIEVGRSHWSGGAPPTGSFSLEQGKMTRRLADMLMLLVERYSLRANWRGYTYVDEMKSHALLQLSQIALQFDESKSENPFAFYTTSIRNCLAGDTILLTREYGAVPIETLVGQEVHLLDGNGEWVLCPILDYGMQETQELAFQGGFETVRIRSTLEHGWITPDNERKLTKDFLGHHCVVADLRPQKTITDMAAYRRGVAHGLIYGDGSAHSVRSFIIRLCGDKARLASWLEEYERTGWESAGDDPIYIVRDPWTDLKALPETPGGDLNYLLGFLRGWLATDGCVSESTNTTLCGSREEYEWVTRWGPLVGWHTRGFSLLARQTNFGERKKASGNMRLKKHSLCADDFLNPKHHARRGEVEAPTVWKTYSHKQDATKRRVERVYCPYVPTTNSMALGCGIHSAQCFTRVLNLEKRNQHIRDDLLIMAGARPSYARQIADEEMQRAQAAVAERAQTPSDDSDAEGA